MTYHLVVEPEGDEWVLKQNGKVVNTSPTEDAALIAEIALCEELTSE